MQTTALLLIWAAATPAARADGDLLGVQRIADIFVAMTTSKWVGQRVEVPAEHPRPDSTIEFASWATPVVVHAEDPRDEQAAQLAAEAVAQAFGVLNAEGWPVWSSDGALGGGPEWDVYLVRGSGGSGADDTGALAGPTRAKSDGLKHFAYLDSASTFAEVDAALPIDDIEGCAVDAWVRSMLLAHEPAESAGWRAATAAWLTWRLTGDFGCQDVGADAAREAALGWTDPQRGPGGGALLAMLSERDGRRDGSFVRELWDFARQRTWDGATLRGDPDLWSALAAMLGDVPKRGRKAHRALDDAIVEFGLARYFTGARAPRGTARAALRNEAPSPVHRLLNFPTKTTSRPIEPTGSAYAILERPNGVDTMRTWLRGEYGVRWSLSIVQLGQDGEILESLSATPTDRQPRAYLPITFAEGTREILVVVTNLSSRRPDADDFDPNARSFSITVDGVRSAPEDAGP